ncbi:MAG: hypothetical protein ABH952_10155 [Candidatus Omnitrophota bacterium]
MMHVAINLLPHDFRVYKELVPLRTKFIFQIIIVLTIVIFLAAAAYIASRKRVLHLFEQRWQELAPQKAEIDALKNQINLYRQRITDIEQLAKREFLWAEKLNAISDALIDGIWLKNIAYEQQFISSQELENPQITRFLIINGTAISRGNNEMSYIGQFLRNLKENSSFIETFENAQLSSVQQRNISGIEVMDFTIVLEFKKESTY